MRTPRKSTSRKKSRVYKKRKSKSIAAKQSSQHNISSKKSKHKASESIKTGRKIVKKIKLPIDIILPEPPPIVIKPKKTSPKR